MQHKSFRGHAAVKDATKGLAEVVVSAYGNVDHDGDIVVKGAVAKQIAGEYGPNPKGLLDHDWSMRSAVAKTLKWWEEDDGLHIDARYNLEKEIGRDAFSDLTFYGDDMEFSVGYAVKKSERPTEDQRSKGCRRVIVEWQVNEWSHVMLGANSETHLVDAKARRQAALEEAVKRGALTPEQLKIMEAKALIGSYEHLTERIRRALLDTFPSEWLWVRGTLADKVVYEREVDTFDGWRSATFEIAYTDTADGITFDGDPVEVTVSEIVEPKGLTPPALEETAAGRFDPLLVARHRLLVASTRT